jgi:hypothetical protein
MIYFSSLLSMSWLSTTLLIDFMVVPLIFRNIPKFFLAGEIGSQLFMKYNRIELLFITLIITHLIFFKKNFRHLKWLLLLSSLLLAITLVYNFYLTQRMREIGIVWEYVDQTGQLGTKNIPDVQQAHQEFHRIYIFLDSFKIGFLLILTSLSLKFKND